MVQLISNRHKKLPFKVWRLLNFCELMRLRFFSPLGLLNSCVVLKDSYAQRLHYRLSNIYHQIRHVFNIVFNAWLAKDERVHIAVRQATLVQPQKDAH